jgi:acyl-CoA thioester hydrolase
MRLDLPAEMTFTNEIVIPIRWGDMDAMGHLNNTVYFRYMETVRIEWFRQRGWMPDASGQGPVIVNAFCTFQRQFEYPGEVLTRHYIGKVGRSSIETYTTMAPADRPEEIRASGGATVVWTDFPSQRSLPLPQAVRARLGV